MPTYTATNDSKIVYCDQCHELVAHYTQDEDGTLMFKDGRSVGIRTYGMTYIVGGKEHTGFPVSCPHGHMKYIEDLPECTAKQARLQFNYKKPCQYHYNPAAKCPRPLDCNACIVKKQYCATTQSVRAINQFLQEKLGNAESVITPYYYEHEAGYAGQANPDLILGDPTYFVRTDGNDNNNGLGDSPTGAWRTWGKAANTLKAGNAVIGHAGTYTENILPLNSGSASAGYITYQAYPGDNVTILYSGTNIYGKCFDTNSKTYLQIIGLNFNGNSYAYSCIWLGGTADHILVQGGSVTNCQCMGLGNDTGSPTNLTIDGVTVSGTNTTYNQECISLSNVNGFEVRGCTVHDPVSYDRVGIDYKDSCNNGLIHHNNVYSLPATPGGNTNPVGIYGGSSGTGTTSTNISIYCNEVNAGVSATGIGINDEQGGGTTSNVTVFNNLVYGNQRGIVINSSALGTTFIGIDIKFNTLYKNGTWTEIWVNTSNISGSYVRDNIIFSQGGTVSAPASMCDHNLIYGTAAVGTNVITQDPQFNNPVAYDFSLKSTSPAIGKASATGAPSFDFAGNARPQGTNYDIGAYQYFVATGVQIVAGKVTTLNMAMTRI